MELTKMMLEYLDICLNLTKVMTALTVVLLIQTIVLGVLTARKIWEK